MGLGELLQAVTSIELVEPSRLTDDQVATALSDLTAAIHRLEAHRPRLVADAEDRSVAAFDGYTTGAAWLADTTVLNDRQARRLLRTARAMASNTEVAAAYETGAVCDEHAVLMPSAGCV